MDYLQCRSLYHYGIRNQKWGERRFQNPDGTYTELGKSRRRVSGADIQKPNKYSTYKKTRKVPDDFEIPDDYVRKDRKLKTTDRDITDREDAFKEYVVKSHDKRLVKKYRDYMTMEEYQEVMNRFNLDQRLDDMISKENKDITKKAETLIAIFSKLALSSI